MDHTARGELPAFARWYEFVRWLLPTTATFPKRLRFTLTQRIDNLALDVVEGLVEARYSRGAGQDPSSGSGRLPGGPGAGGPPARARVA